MMTLILTLGGLFTGAILMLLALTNASRQWRELNGLREENAKTREAISTQSAALDRDRKQFEKQAVSYKELADENAILKADLRNIEVNLNKTQVDRDLTAEAQIHVDERSRELAARYLADVEKWVGSSITANNYAACKQRLMKVIEWCKEIGFQVPREREDQLLADLKADYECAVRAALEREEQTRIKAQIREEQLREKEVQRELQTLERERIAIQAALAQALAATRNEHSDEVERLKARLAEAESKSARAISQAQLTKAGHLYVISNVGSFGEGVFKIGMTRRLEPLERVGELSDASVPFGFDVHMMVSCSDAPSLENTLHRHFHKRRINKVNLRKEFFRVDLDEIRKIVEDNHGEVNYMADAAALEYRQSITMTEEDEAYIEQVFEAAEAAVGAPVVED